MEYSNGKHTGWSVALLSEQYAPDIGSTAQLLAELMGQLRSKGAGMRVLTMKPGYVKNAPSAPMREVRDGLSIMRMPRLPFARTNRKGEALNWIWGTVCLMGMALTTPRYMPLLVVTNPPMAHLAGAWMKFLRGQRFIALFYDLHPELSCAVGVLREGSLLDRGWRRLNRWILKQADVAICLGEHMEAVVKQRLPQANTVVIHNWCDPAVVRAFSKRESRFAREHGLVDKFVVMFSGNMGWRQRMEILLEVATELKADDRIRFVFIGEGAKKAKLQDIAQRRGLTNVLFFPYQPRELMEHSLAAADLAVASQEREVVGFGVPCKTYTYMASGRAILGLASRPCELIDLVSASKCGWVFDEDHDKDAIVAKLRELAEFPDRCLQAGQRARKYFESNFTLQIIAEQYAAIIRKQFELSPAPALWSRIFRRGRAVTRKEASSQPEPVPTGELAQ